MMTVQNDLIQYDGAGNAALNIIANNVHFMLGTGAGKFTSSEDGTIVNRQEGAKKLFLQNLETTDIANFVVINFGDTVANARANLTITGTTPNKISTTGIVVRSGMSAASIAVLPREIIIDWPAGMQHMAIGNGVANVTNELMVSQSP